MESLPVDPLDAILVKKQAVQHSQTTEGVLAQAPEPIAMQEKVAEVEEVDEQIVFQELQLVVLQQGGGGQERRQIRKWLINCRT